jgi:ribosomal-protein-alanine N-acetyltransferase
MPELRLETPRLIIGLPQPEQASQAVPFITRNRDHFAPWRPPEPHGLHTDAYWRKQIPLMHEGFAAGTNVRLWMWEKADLTHMIGTIGFTQIFRGPFCSCMLGYQLSHDYEGKGYMREALQTGIRYMFDVRQLHRIAASYRPENVRSGKLLTRLGFRIDGFSKNYLFIDGAWRDHILTSLVSDAFRPEWLTEK